MDGATAMDQLSADGLRGRLPELMLRDDHRLRRRLDELRHIHDDDRRTTLLARIADEVERAEQRIARRRAVVPTIRYPEQLPVSQRRDDLLEALAASQVVVVAGETGSGKTTQLPKLLLELGRGVRGTIGHTQPRRLAARTVAERIAEELDTELGHVIGYKVRFTDRSGEDTLVKLMTDGVLLAELQRDRDLRAYDTIVLDEAHERSLNIDFLLGYLAQLLPRRPDLKVVITSATIETGRFSQHFGGAPVVEVSGRTFPVEVRYRPLVRQGKDDDKDDDDEPRDQVTAICDAVGELQAEGPGDVLVFLSGEREIRDTADALPGRVGEGIEVLPLYSRLSAAEQHRVFAPSRGNRVVLATNVAETSLTVPGIRYVVDPGTARISRYSLRTKVQRLPIEAISRASADQRKGRCGRVAAGICIRLYSEDDFAGRPEFTDPEIVRTNLASVILQMTALGLGDVAAFPFVDPPDRRNVKDGLELLHELGAVGSAKNATTLTAIGRRLARLPLDPRLGRMVVEADRNGCMHEVLVLAAALSIQDPRERPVDRRQAADELHARFRDEHSDFTAYLNLWGYLQERQDELSSSAFRRLCKREHLHYLRVREWQDLYGQLRSAVRDLGFAVDERSPSDPLQVHRSVLAGLLSHIGLKDPEKGDYVGARGARFVVWPGSALAKKQPRWVVAAELVETSRLFGRTVARTDPADVERLAQHLVKRQYSEPHWEKKRAGVVAVERVTLYGVPIVVGRKVDYGRIEPELSRELFLRHALVEGDWETHHAFFTANLALLDDVASLEDRARRRDLVVDDEALFDFYDARIPADVVSGRHFDAWWKQARRTTPDLLTLTAADLLSGDADAVSALDFPDVWVQGDLRLPLSYVFEAGHPHDGVTAQVALPVLNRVDAGDLAWQVPGLRAELATALLKTLPKPVRRQLGPAPNRTAALLAALPDRGRPLVDALADELRRSTGIVVGPDDWDWSRVPAHLRMTFQVVDGEGKVVGIGKDLDALRRSLAPRVQQALSTVAVGVERTGVTSWTIGTLPRTVEQSTSHGTVRGFPALVDDGSSVTVRVLASQAEQDLAHARGTRRLLLLDLPSPLKAVVGRMPNATKLALAHNPYGSVPALLDDAVAAAVDALVAEAGGPAWDAEGWDRLRGAVRPALERAVEDVVRVAGTVLAAAADVEQRLSALTHPLLQPAVDDVRSQLAGLVGPGFVSASGRRRLDAVLRYLQAAQRRLDRLRDDVERDRGRMREVQQLEREYGDLVAKLPPDRRAAADVTEVRWMLEELRVSLFAPPMKTAYPVSEKRVLRAMDALLP